MDAPRYRMAPSPTGSLHIGNARTGLYNYLLARKSGGTFILRIEDTSRDRSRPEYEKTVLDGFRWLGMEWDEGPDAGGPHGPYRQSERLDTHQEWLRKLAGLGHTYRCFCTAEELDAERQEAQKAGRPPKYSGKCRGLAQAEVERRLAGGSPAAYRFKVEPRPVRYRDLVLGDLEEDSALWGDFVIARADGSPVYNFAVVIDDHLMAITHAVRGADHISNTFKQIVMYEAFGVRPPEFGHLPLILNAKREKLSKRDGSVAVEEYREQGYLPEAVVNFIALLGWNPGDEREIFSMDELIREFSLERVNKSNAVFDFGRLDWFNGIYIRKMPVEELARRVRPFVERAGLDLGAGGDGYFEAAVALEQDRVKKLSDFPAALRFFLVDRVEPDPKDLVRKNRTPAETAAALEKVRALVSEHGVDGLEETESMLRALAAELGWNAGDLFMCVRVALTGSTATPPLFQTMRVLGKQQVIRRLGSSISLLAGAARDSHFKDTR